MRRTRRTSEVVYLIKRLIQGQRLRNIMLPQGKSRIHQKHLDIFSATRVEIVEAYNMIAFVFQKPEAEIRPEKSRTACHQDTLPIRHSYRTPICTY